MPRIFRKSEWLFLTVAVGLALAAAAFYYWSRPSSLTVAVGPRDGPEAKLVQAYADALAQEKKNVRLRLVPYDDVKQSAEALVQKKADFAVVRPDVLLPENGLTVAILRQEAVLIVTPAASKIAEVADLARKRLGVVTGHEADPEFIGSLLAKYDLSPPAVTTVPLQLDEVEAAFAAKRIDAVVLIAAPAGSRAASLVQAVSRAAGGKIKFVPVSEGEALILKNPALVTLTIPAGVFSGRPKEPAEEVKTIGVSYRLQARSDLNRDRVSLVTEYLFEMRPRLARATSSAYQLRPPEFDTAATATSATLPNHPGAVDYLQREQQTFFQRYGDWIYLLMFSGGGIFSAFAWMFQGFARKRRELVDKVLDRLLDILSEARGAKEIAELDKLALEVDGLVTHAVRYARRHAAGTRSVGTLILALDSARAAIADQRRSLVDEAKLRSQPIEKLPAPAKKIGSL